MCMCVCSVFCVQGMYSVGVKQYRRYSKSHHHFRQESTCKMVQNIQKNPQKIALYSEHIYKKNLLKAKFKMYSKHPPPQNKVMQMVKPMKIIEGLFSESWVGNLWQADCCKGVGSHTPNSIKVAQTGERISSFCLLT